MIRTTIVLTLALAFCLAPALHAAAGDRGGEDQRRTKITLNSKQIEAIEAAAGKPVTIELTQGQQDALKRLDSRCGVKQFQMTSEHLGSAHDVLLELSQDALKVNPIPSPKEA